MLRLHLLGGCAGLATRRVLAWRLSNSTTTDFYLDALEAAIRDCGPPTILNTDQGWHSALDGQTPDMVYFSLRPQRKAS